MVDNALITFVFFSLFMLSVSFVFDQKKEKELDEMIKRQKVQINSETVGIIVVNSSSTIFQKIYSNIEGVNEKTPFILGSVSKSFTALGLSKLDILPNTTLEDFDLGDYLDEDSIKKITVGELLTHTSGLDSFSNKIIGEKGHFSYSNYGYDLLGKIIEKKSGKKYNEFMKENIFDKLNMVNTHAIYNSSIIDSYSNFFGFNIKYRSLESEFGDGFYIPAGFISSSIEDMGIYLRYYLNNKDYLLQMFKTEIGYNEDYGGGLFIQKRTSQTIYEHGGETNTFLNQIYIFPDLNLAFAVLTNTVDIFSADYLFSNFIKNIESFLVNDVYEEINDSVYFYSHFTMDMIVIIGISIPLTYFIITLIRKIKRKPYLWFKGIKGIIIFVVDVLLLFILPIFILIISFGIQSIVKLAIAAINDFYFMVIVISVTLLSTFIIKLIYCLLYKKYSNSNKKYNSKRDASLSDLIDMNDDL